jgi:pyrimidine operon attenuation protein/uracil phosphoribosyltransferase
MVSKDPRSREQIDVPRGGGTTSCDHSSLSESPTVAYVLARDDVSRVLTRMAHEIIERNHHADPLHIIGIQRGGVWLAERLVASVRTIRGEVSTHFGSLDVSLFRDDISLRPVTAISTSTIDGDLTGATVVLVDDVLFTGRTVRAALDALAQFGRPGRVQLAVLVDRGHRELPIRPDFVGKNLPTSRTADVVADDTGVRIVEGELR